MEVRPVGPDDLPFLLEMTLLAAFPPGPLPEGAAEMARVTRWTTDWARPGDIGVVAWADGERIGAAWCRIHEVAAACDEHGGPLPEAAIAVLAAHRSRGVGAELLRALGGRAAQLGCRGLSLTVNAANPALHLYEREGYVPVRREGDTLTMMVALSG